MQVDEDYQTIEMFRFPRLRGDQVLDVLATIAEEHGDLDAIGLKLQKTEAGWYSIYLPAYRGRDDTEARRRIHRDLVTAAQVTLGNAAVGRGSQQAAPFSTEGMFAAGSGATILTANSASQVPLDEMPEEMLVLARHGERSSAIASVLRQGRQAALMTGAEDRVAIFVDNAAERYGTVSDMIGRRDLPADFAALRPWVAGRATLWLSVELGPPSTRALAALGRIWAASARSPDGTTLTPPDVACLRAANDTGSAIHILPALAQDKEKLVEDIIAPALEPTQLFDIETYTYSDAKTAAKDLTAEIIRNADRIGYRVRLHPVPQNVGAGMDVEPLLEQIEDLRLRIAQINALGAPQQRLLRFSDAQVPAMVDALRRLSPDVLRDGSLKYAAGHSQGRSEPAHYLLYDATATHVRFPQTLWQAQTEARPMTYWLEPFVAQAQMAQPTKTRVFVPDRHMLSPSLAHFGGDVDGTLKLVLGALFVSLGELACDPERKPFFIFTQLPGKTDMMDVEVIDGDQFAPVQQQIGWMNDYLQVRGPNVVDRDKLQALAEELYEGAFVDEVRHGLEDHVTAATRAWDGALDTLRAEASGILQEHVRELSLVSERIAQAHSYLENAEQELTGLEELMAIAAKALTGRSEVAPNLATRYRDIRAAGETFTEAMDRELTEGTKRIAAAEEKLAILQARLDTLNGWRR